MPKSIIELLTEDHARNYPTPTQSFYDQYQNAQPDARATNRVPEVYMDPTLRFDTQGSAADEANRKRRGYAPLPISGVSGNAALQMVPPAVTMPAAAVSAAPTQTPAMPPVQVPAVPTTATPTMQGAPRIFPSDAGMPGAYNMGNVPGMIPTNAQGVPLGQDMVPVTGMTQGSASIGMPSNTPYASPALPSDAGIMPTLPNVPYAPGAVPDLGGAAVLQATNEEKSTLDRMRHQGRTLEQQDSVYNRLKEFERGQQEATNAANRQIQVARGTPQISSGPGGVIAWDPTANNGRGGVIQEVRPAAERVQRSTSLSDARDQDLLAMHSRFSTRPADKNNSMYQFAMQMAKTPQEKAAVEAQFQHAGDPEALAAVEAEMARRPTLKNMVPGAGAQPPSAGAPATPAAGAAAGTTPARKYAPDWK